MRTRLNYLLPPLMLLAAPAIAAPEAEAAVSDWNPTRFILLFIAVVLVFANGLLAYVIRQLAGALLDKKLRDRVSITGKSLTLLIAAMAFGGHAFAYETAIPVAIQPTPPEEPLLSGIPAGEFWFLSGLIGFLMLCLIVMVFLVRMLSRALREDPARAHVPAEVLKRNFLDVFNKSVAVEEERGILLDHDYDGIKELDNDLPPWWKWGFVATVVSAIIYLGYYHAWGGPDQAQEYELAVRSAETEKAKYLAKAGEQIDETNVSLVQDAGQLSEAKELFINVCAACHRPDAGGNVGPNLTDDYWLHGGSLQSVFKSIKYGWRDKGMPPWNGNLSARQIAGIASYIKGLKNSNPAGGKAPQGERFVEGNDNALDSVTNVTAPSLTPGAHQGAQG